MRSTDSVIPAVLLKLLILLIFNVDSLKGFISSSMTLEKYALHKNFAYYAGIMLDAFAILLCSKLCWHNWLKSTKT